MAELLVSRISVPYRVRVRVHRMVPKYCAVAHHGLGGHRYAGQILGGVGPGVEHHPQLPVGDQQRALGGAVHGVYPQVDAGGLIGQHGVGHVQHTPHRAGHIVRREVQQHPLVYRHQVHVPRGGGGGEDQGRRQRKGAQGQHL